MGKSPAASAAAKVRAFLKRNGINPKGCVRVESSDYHTEIIISVRGMGEDLEYELGRFIDTIDDRGQFSWCVE